MIAKLRECRHGCGATLTYRQEQRHKGECPVWLDQRKPVECINEACKMGEGGTRASFIPPLNNPKKRSCSEACCRAHARAYDRARKARVRETGVEHLETPEDKEVRHMRNVDKRVAEIVDAAEELGRRIEANRERSYQLWESLLTRRAA